MIALTKTAVLRRKVEHPKLPHWNFFSCKNITPKLEKLRSLMIKCVGEI
jgi:hypothetical protein